MCHRKVLMKWLAERYLISHISHVFPVKNKQKKNSNLWRNLSSILLAFTVANSAECPHAKFQIDSSY